MTRYVGLLRAVNVGGTGRLPMADLRALCSDIGLTDIATYIASGNVVFRSDLAVAAVKDALQSQLADYAGKPVPVMIRTAAEIAEVFAANPYADAPGNRVVAVFCDASVPDDALDHARHLNGEQITIRDREIYIHYPTGQGASKLTIPAATAGTARNMNTVQKLVEMSWT